jgi:hypothetical protein
VVASWIFDSAVGTTGWSNLSSLSATIWAVSGIRQVQKTRSGRYAAHTLLLRWAERGKSKSHSDCDPVHAGQREMC